LALRYVDGRGPLLADRAANGCVVDGHGDLIAEDVFCLADGPRVLDCLEFDDRLRWVDVLDDVAFLAMDLEHLGAPGAAERFLSWYREFSAMPVVPSLQHHFIAYRAFVRSKVASIRAAQQGEHGAADGLANAFAKQALRHLHAGEVRMVLVGGAPGTGKSTLASALADRLGAVLLSSDHVRRELPLAAGARYTDAGKDATYAAVLSRARASLEHGESVVLDATFGQTAWRRAAARVADTTASTPTAFECRAPAALAARRARHRLALGHDASEADAAVAVQLAGERDPWPQAVGVDTSGDPQEALSLALMAFDASAAS
jgi:predicted kinase